MGAADVVPGVSGGTMAFILGIYEELITALRSFDTEFVRLLSKGSFREALERVSWRFLVSVGVGILAAVFSLARGLSWLLVNQPVLIWSFFFGLIAASVFTVSRRVTRWGAVGFVSLFSGAALTYALVGMVPMESPETPWFLFLSGALAICAMILPGISGAFVLVLLGKYLFVLEAVNQRDVAVLGIVAAGAVFGLLSFARLLGWLFKRYHNATVALLTGLMLGSLRKVWPWKETASAEAAYQANVLPPALNGEAAWALGLALLGCLLVLLLHWLGERKSGAAP
jgi:putative membrane protein